MTAARKTKQRAARAAVRKHPKRPPVDPYQTLYSYVNAMQNDEVIAKLEYELLELRMTGPRGRRRFELVLEERVPARRRRRKAKR